MNRGRSSSPAGSLGGLTAGLLLADPGLDVTVHERSPAELRAARSRHRLPPRQLPLPRRAGGGRARRDQHRHRHGSATSARRRRRPRPGPRVPVQLVEHGLPPAARVLRPAPLPPRLRGHRVREARTTRYGSSSPTTSPIDADLLVCADGVGSPARRRLLPDVRPAYAGYVAWRGMVPEADLDDRHPRRARRRDHLLRVRQQPHPPVPDPRAGRLGGAGRAARSTSCGTATTSTVATSTI